MDYIESEYFDGIKYAASNFMWRLRDFFGTGVVNPPTAGIATGDFPLSFPATPNMTININGAGTAWALGQRTHVPSSRAPFALTFASNSSGNPRVDLIQAGPISIASVITSLGVGQDLGAVTVKQGTPASSPSAPYADTGCVPLFSVAVANGATALTSGNVTDLRVQVPMLTGLSGYITGEVRHVALAAPPAGWLACDGSAVSRSTYAALFAAIGTTFGVGNGTTTFNIPDMRGRFPIGAGTSTTTTPTARVLGSEYGAEQLAVSDLPAHLHPIGGSTSSGGTHTHDPANGGSYITNSAIGLSSGNTALAGTGADTWGQQLTANSGAHTHAFPANTGNSAASTTNPCPPATCLLYIIRAI